MQADQVSCWVTAAALACSAAAWSETPYLMTTIVPTPANLFTLGGTCAIAGDRAIMGGQKPGGSLEGAVTIVRLGESGTYTTEAILHPPLGQSPFSGDEWPVDICGDLAAVGVPNFVPSPSGGLGKVFIYRHERGEWILDSTLGPLDLREANSWMFGYSLAMNGTFLAVSDIKTGSGADRNRVHIFERVGVSAWNLVAQFEGTRGSIPAVAIHDSTLSLTVGVTQGSGGPKFLLFRFDGASWVPDGEVSHPDASGWKPALHGDTLAVTLATERIGLFKRVAPATWESTGELDSPGPPVEPGGWLALLAFDGDTLIAGPWRSNGSEFNSALRWQRTGAGNWEPAESLSDPGSCTTSMLFVSGIAIEGDSVVVTSPSACGGYGVPEGYAHVFDLTPSDCDSDGVADVDTDGDGVTDCTDADDDDDGTLDATDGCPLDPLKSAPGQCGCGLPEGDADGDSLCDVADNCPLHANPDQADCDGDGVGDVCAIAAGVPDANGNGIPDRCDAAACPGDVNVDGFVNGADLAVVLGFWGPVGTFASADIDGSGNVDAGDLAILLGGWGACN